MAGFSIRDSVLRAIPSLLDIRVTLKQLEDDPDAPHYQELRRWLLISIADLEERTRQRESTDVECA